VEIFHLLIVRQRKGEILLISRFDLSYKSVLIYCLNADKNRIESHTASGFITKEQAGYFLYTCWHVVTGYGDPFDFRFPKSPSVRMYLEIVSMSVGRPQEGVVTLGGSASIIVPLYSKTENGDRPVWLQDEAHRPCEDLNKCGIYIPEHHDLVKIRLPSDFYPADLQCIAETSFYTVLSQNGISNGEQCYVVGYPYGYSLGGQEMPIPVVLTRFIAGSLMGRWVSFILESTGAPSMSGGPVFVERNGELLLFGMYTGAIFPNSKSSNVEEMRVTSLGLVSGIYVLLGGNLNLVNVPTRSVTVRKD
jgi:hypothetical protein